MANATSDQPAHPVRPVDREDDARDVAGRRVEDAAGAAAGAGAPALRRPAALAARRRGREPGVEAATEGAGAAPAAGAARGRDATALRADHAGPRPLRRPQHEPDPRWPAPSSTRTRTRSSIARRPQGPRLLPADAGRDHRRVHQPRRLPVLRRRAADLAPRDRTPTSSGEVDRVAIVYPRFVNTVVQRPELQAAAAGDGAGGRASVKAVDYIYEPDAEARARGRCCRATSRCQVYRAVLELAASEQSARMVAMRNATDAAKEMIRDADAGLQQGAPGADHEGAARHRRAVSRR